MELIWWFCIDCLCEAKVGHPVDKSKVFIVCPICGDKKVISKQEAEYYLRNRKR